MVDAISIDAFPVTFDTRTTLGVIEVDSPGGVALPVGPRRRFTTSSADQTIGGCRRRAKSESIA